MKPRRIALITSGILLATALLLIMRRDSSLGSMEIQGAVLRQDRDLRRQQPIANARVEVRSGTSLWTGKTNGEGYFRIPVRRILLPGSQIVFIITHPDFEPLHTVDFAGLRAARHQLHIFRLIPTSPDSTQQTSVASPVRVTGLRVRYVENGSTENNIGSISRTFEVKNRGNQPCDSKSSCSPDGRWKAAQTQLPLNAGAGNRFEALRISCIAGPCPFTRTETFPDANNPSILTVKAWDWSDTATFLVEAEIYHTSFSSAVHHLFPVLFGRTLNFTLPSNEEGVSIEAELNGTMMVFPLGPEGDLSWGSCEVRESESSNPTHVYHCELKPGFSF